MFFLCVFRFYFYFGFIFYAFFDLIAQHFAADFNEATTSLAAASEMRREGGEDRERERSHCNTAAAADDDDDLQPDMLQTIACATPDTLELKKAYAMPERQLNIFVENEL